eukprot:scaffold73106_cov39-Phaeocystis_antarctica.AAC.1
MLCVHGALPHRRVHTGACGKQKARMTAASQDISANGPRLAKAGGGPEPYLALWRGVSKL